MRYLTEQELVALIPDADVIALVHAAYQRLGHERRVVSRPAASFMVAEHAPPVLLPLKGAVATGLGMAGALIGAQHGDYVFVVCDSRTGQLQGIVEQAAAIKRRTAASALVAARLAGATTPKTVAVIGAGRIAEALVRLLPHAMPSVASVRVAARSVASATRFADALRDATGADLVPAGSVADAVADADLVFTISNAAAPVIHAGMLARGVTLCALGGGAELAADVLPALGRLLVDDADYAMTRGSLASWVRGGHVAREALARRIDADLGQVAIGTASGRQDSDETVLAVVQGLALCDLEIAVQALRRGAERGVGRTLAVAPQSERDPAPATSSAAALIDAWRQP